MSIYHIYAGAAGESHIEEAHLAQHPALGALMHAAQAGIHEFSALRSMDFHPLPERRLIIHSRGESVSWWRPRPSTVSRSGRCSWPRLNTVECMPHGGKSNFDGGWEVTPGVERPRC